MQSAIRYLRKQGWLLLLGVALVLFIHGTYLRYGIARDGHEVDVLYDFDEQLPRSVLRLLNFSAEQRIGLVVFPRAL